MPRRLCRCGGGGARRPPRGAAGRIVFPRAAGAPRRRTLKTGYRDREIGQTKHSRVGKASRCSGAPRGAHGSDIAGAVRTGRTRRGFLGTAGPSGPGRRVRSWLRMNAGGAPNTCKSNGRGAPGRRGSGERLSNTWATCPSHRDSLGKPGVIPDAPPPPHGGGGKAQTARDGPAAC